MSNIGSFSYRAAIRDLDKQPLNAEEYKTLQQLYKKSADIQQELRNVQHLVLENNLRWMDVELALATNNRPNDNTIIDGFKTVEKTSNLITKPTLALRLQASKRERKGLNIFLGKRLQKKKQSKLQKRFSV